MQNYPLQSLLNVRTYREKNAQNAVRQAERIYKEWIEKCEKQQEALKEYHTWRLQEEEKRYAEILGTILRMDELEHFKQNLSMLKAKEISMEEELLEFEKQKELAKNDINIKKEAFKTAKKNTAKIDTHKSIWKQEEKKDQERKEDLESEEFKPLATIGTENDE